MYVDSQSILARWSRPYGLLVLCALNVGAARAAELLYVADRVCGPCILFERQIGPIYPKTEEADRAPLRMIPYGKPAPVPYAFIGQPAVAPTFVLVEDGRELGRFEGYENDELFWMNLARLMQALDSR